MAAYGSEERVMPRKIHINKVKNKLRVVSNSGPGRDWIFLLLELVQVCRQVALKVRCVDQGRGAANVLPEAAVVQPEVSHLAKQLRLEGRPIN